MKIYILDNSPDKLKYAELFFYGCEDVECISVKVSTGAVQRKKERTKTPLQTTGFARFKHIQTRLSNR